MTDDNSLIRDVSNLPSVHTLIFLLIVTILTSVSFFTSPTLCSLSYVTSMFPLSQLRSCPHADHIHSKLSYATSGTVCSQAVCDAFSHDKHVCRQQLSCFAVGDVRLPWHAKATSHEDEIMNSPDKNQTRVSPNVFLRKRFLRMKRWKKVAPT